MTPSRVFACLHTQLEERPRKSWLPRRAGTVAPGVNRSPLGTALSATMATTLSGDPAPPLGSDTANPQADGDRAAIAHGDPFAGAEWVGWECKFSEKDGSRIAVPYDYVPRSLRDWDVEVGGFKNRARVGREGEGGKHTIFHS